MNGRPGLGRACAGQGAEEAIAGLDRGRLASQRRVELLGNECGDDEEGEEEGEVAQHERCGTQHGGAPRRALVTVIVGRQHGYIDGLQFGPLPPGITELFGWGLLDSDLLDVLVDVVNVDDLGRWREFIGRREVLLPPQDPLALRLGGTPGSRYKHLRVHDHTGTIGRA